MSKFSLRFQESQEKGRVNDVEISGEFNRVYPILFPYHAPPLIKAFMMSQHESHFGGRKSFDFTAVSTNAKKRCGRDNGADLV